MLEYYLLFFIPFALPFTLATWLVLLWFRLKLYLQMYQQDEYDGRRFISWLVRSRSFDLWLSLGLISIYVMAYLPRLPSLQLGTFERIAIYGFLSTVLQYVQAILLIVIALFNMWSLKKSKKKLVMTSRAKRVFFTAIVSCFLFGLIVHWLVVQQFVSVLVFSAFGDKVIYHGIAILVLVQLIPLSLPFANLILTPIEKSIQNKYWQEAHDKLAKINPTVIGITGSFGKTSCKHILAHILDTAAPTLATPGSVNTPMGISRILREKLTENHRYFIAEMGAYGKGSIELLCRLSPPKVGIITAIGKAHFERFRSLETVAKTKFELAEAVAKQNGKIILPSSLLNFESAKQFKNDHSSSLIVLDNDEGGNEHPFRLGQCEVTTEGIRQQLWQNGAEVWLEAPLFGTHHGLNIALCYMLACHLGLDADLVRRSIKSIPQTTHRLEVKKQAGGWTLIDDAYNSNPQGFSAALDVLELLAGSTKGRRILVTPGMVELGDAHDEEHQKLGTRAATKVDILVAVRPSRIQAFVDGFEDNKHTHAKVHKVDSFKEAEVWLNENIKPGDVVLLENDLPDIYERKRLAI